MSDAQQRFERVFPVPADALFAAVGDAISAGPYKKATTDAFTRSVVFQSRRSLMSWGHHWQGQVVEDPAGSKLVLTAQVTISSEGPGSGKRASEVATRLLGDVSARLQATVGK